MSRHNTPTVTERVAGSALTELALTAIGASAGTPLAALLPVLSNTLASKRHQSRVDAALNEISLELEKQADKLQTLTDDQYKVISSAVASVFESTSKEKLAFLRRFIVGALDGAELSAQSAVVLSRVIRDISTDEVQFIMENFHYERLGITNVPREVRPGCLQVLRDTPEALVMTGLTSLGVLETCEATWDDGGLLRFSSIAAKLMVLVGAPTPSGG